MIAFRLLVLTATIVAIAVAPLLWGRSGPLAAAEAAQASMVTGSQSGSSTALQANDNDENNNDNNADDNDNDNADENDNTDDNNNDNDNADGNDNADDGDDNDNTDDIADEPVTEGTASGSAGGGPVGATGGADVFPSVRCYDVGMVGAINLHLEGGGVTLDVVPVSSFQQVSEVSLSGVDPASVPAPPGPILEDFVFDVQALNGCSGPEIGQLPAPVNLGIAYEVPADKGSLQIAYWDGTNWVDVQTVPDPDPNKPYVSATIQSSGTYTVYTE
jgi:hypothetical protein